MKPRALSAAVSFAVALASAPAWSANVQGALRLDPDVPLGADPAGRLRLFAPNPVDPGSSISHWDLPATPDLLMEPYIAPGAPIGETDLTIEQLRDIGWMAGSSSVVVQIADAPGEGFLVPGSLGAHRRAAIERVAEIWGALLRSSVPIHLEVSFEDLPCDDGSATLAQAGPTFIFESFSGADIVHTWYPGALAESLSGANLSLEDDVDPDAGDIKAMFNTAIDNGCLGGGATFDYSLDGATRPGRLSFVNVALHEVGHGLGFVSLVNESNGANPLGIPDLFSFFMRDTKSGLLWHQMTDAERVASATNTGRLVWDGPNVNGAAPSFLPPGPVLQIDSPASVHGGYEVATAQFGPALSEAGVGGLLVAADDGSAAPREGCRPLVNGAALQGRIAMVMRGNCSYADKVKNAQNAGAAGVVVVSNVEGPPMPLGGNDPSITIPAVMIRKEDGDRLFALTDVDTVIEVADTQSGRVLTYHNPQGRAFPAVQDTSAFPTCP